MKRAFPALILTLVCCCTAFAQTAKEVYDNAHELYASGDYEGALAEFTQVTEMNPDHEMAWFFRGHTNIILKNFADAVQDFTRVIERMPDYPDAYFSRGNAKMELTDLRSAIGDFSQTIRLDSNFTEAYYQRGICRREILDDKGFCKDMRMADRLGYEYATNILPEYCE